MIPYILHSAFLLSGCFLFYKWLLEKETYFRLNRGILLLCMGIAVLLPLLVIPAHWSYSHQLQAVSPVEHKALSLPDPIVSQVEPIPLDPHTSPFQPFDEGTKSLSPHSPIAVPPKASFTDLVPSIEPEVAKTLPNSQPFSWKAFLGFIYLTGLAIFGLSLLVQFFSLAATLWRAPKFREGRYILAEIPNQQSPFSFGPYICMSPDLIDKRQVLAHEKIHVDQKHSLDIVLAEILLVFQWFNPFAWMYRKAVKQNLEYLTDEEMLTKGYDPSSYQESLVRVSAPNHTLAITANYNHSLLKKRILMMQAKRSSLQAGWKYLALLPLLGISTSFLNGVYLPATNIEKGINEVSGLPDSTLYMETEVEEVELNQHISEEGLAAPMPLQDSLLEKPEKFIQLSPFISLSGTWKGKIRAEEFCIALLQNEQEKHYYQYSECYNLNKFPSVKAVGTSKVDIHEFTLEKEEGSLLFEGSFDEGRGRGSWVFESRTAYEEKLASMGIAGVGDEFLFRLFLSDDNSKYIENAKELQSLGLSGDLLEDFMTHMAPANLVKEYQEAGLDLDETTDFLFSRVDPSDLIAYQEAGLSWTAHEDFIHSRVPPKFLKGYMAAGLDLEENEDYIHSRVPPEFLKEYMDSGLDLEKHEDFIHSRVPTEFLKGYMAAGLDLEENEDYIHSRVPPEFLKEYMDAGLDLEKHEDYIHSRVPTEFLKGYMAAGLDLEENEDYIHSRVPPEFLKEYMDSGLDMEKNEEYIHSRVPTEFLKGYMAAGLDLEENEDYIHSRVPPEFLKEYMDAGLDLEKHEDYIHSRVPPEFLKEYMDAGIDLDEHEDYIHSRVPPGLLMKYRDVGLDLDKHEEYIHSRVDPDLLRKYMDIGLSLDEHEDFIHGRVSPEFLRKYLDAGMDLEEHEDFIHSRVDPEFLKRYLDAGLDLRKYEDFIHSRVDGRFLQKYIDAGLDPFKYETFIHRRMDPQEILKIREQN